LTTISVEVASERNSEREPKKEVQDLINQLHEEHRTACGETPPTITETIAPRLQIETARTTGGRGVIRIFQGRLKVKLCAGTNNLNKNRSVSRINFVQNRIKYYMSI
jgi:hypothetical protein